MIKKLLRSVREFKAAAIKAPVYISLEVIMECIIPLIMANLIDQGINAGSMPVILKMGLLLLLFGRKTVVFETDCDIRIPEQKVWKGGAVERPVEPKRPGRIFAGWYCDEQRLRRWDFEEDMVEDNMTLYAKWI